MLTGVMLLSVFSLVSSLRLTQASSLYSGDQLLSLSVASPDQADLVTSLRGDDLWSAVSLIRPVVIHCTRDQCPELKSFLRDHGIQFSVEVEDLAAIAGLYPMKPSTVNASKYAGLKLLKHDLILRTSCEGLVTVCRGMTGTPWRTCTPTWTTSPPPSPGSPCSPWARVSRVRICGWQRCEG